MRANKLETVLSRDHLACLAPPDRVFLMYKLSYMYRQSLTLYNIHVYVQKLYMYMYMYFHVCDSVHGFIL